MAIEKGLSIINKFRDISSKKCIPIQTTLELTHECNQKCPHCYLTDDLKGKGKLLNYDEWSKILVDLRENGALYLILMGGEAMLHPDFWKILEKSVELGFHTSVVTNGQLINEKEVAQKLFDIGLSHITFSVYSLKPATHDEMTQNPGSLERSIKAINLCLEVGLQVGINCLLTQKNIDDYFDLANFCQMKEIKILEDPIATCNFNGEFRTGLERPSEEQLKDFYSKRALFWEKSIPKPDKLKATDPICNMARSKAAIDPYGNVHPCVEIREVLGNLTKESFSEIWSNEKTKKWRDLTVGDIKIDDFSLLAFLDQCPGMSLNELGDSVAVIEYCEVVARIKKELWKNSRG